MLATLSTASQSAPTAADVICRTSLKTLAYRGPLGHGAERSANIRRLFSALGWHRYLQVTKGGWTLGAAIDWKRGQAPSWYCAEAQATRQEDPFRRCLCDECQRLQEQREAVMRRVHYVINEAFRGAGREVGNRSDSQSDYFDADYTFHA